MVFSDNKLLYRRQYNRVLLQNEDEIVTFCSCSYVLLKLAKAFQKYGWAQSVTVETKIWWSEIKVKKNR